MRLVWLKKIISLSSLVYDIIFHISTHRQAANITLALTHSLLQGKIDPGETVNETVLREFGEEAMNSKEASKEGKALIEKATSSLLVNGIKVYAGYVDDPRNTDNAWMETVAMLYHDHDGAGLSKLALQAGDDAAEVSGIPTVESRW